MKPSELRDKTDDELRELEQSLRKKLLDERMAVAAQRPVKPSEIRALRRDIARIQTILRARELGKETSP